jgi:ribonuclease P protein component
LPDNDFPKSSRLRKSSEFKEVFRKGRKIVTQTLVFHVLKTNLGGPRLGLAVSRKVGKAVKRNKVKRRIREVFRTRKNVFPASYDLVVYPRKGVLDKGIADYCDSFEFLLTKLNRKRSENPSRN